MIYNMHQLHRMLGTATGHLGHLGMESALTWSKQRQKPCQQQGGPAHVGQYLGRVGRGSVSDRCWPRPLMATQAAHRATGYKRIRGSPSDVALGTFDGLQ